MLVDRVKYSDLCVLLSKLRDAKGANVSSIRRKHFEKFITGCTEQCDDCEETDEAIYSVVRLVLTSLDPRTMSIKEKKLVDRVCKAMAISSTDIEGLNISNATEVCEILANEVSSRIAPDDFEHLSIAEINERLDNMSINAETVGADLLPTLRMKTEAGQMMCFYLTWPPGNIVGRFITPIQQHILFINSEFTVAGCPPASRSTDLQFLFKNCSQNELFWLFCIMIKNVE
ncbi:hypothetical protein DICVIV_05770, partial [Dictyocaulus viviparus]